MGVNRNVSQVVLAGKSVPGEMGRCRDPASPSSIGMIFSLLLLEPDAAPAAEQG